MAPLTARAGSAPSSPPSLGSAGGEARSAAAELDPGTGRYVIGSLVEYKSRSSGNWILSKVEGFDERTKVYRLDVQQNAKPERIRLRTDSCVPAGESAGQPQGQHPQQEVDDHCAEVAVAAVASTASAAAAASAAAVASDTASVDALRNQVVKLQALNMALHEQLAQEITLKEGYYSEMCVYRDQLQCASEMHR
mmetsp:Transcript_116042/g.369194  ORF Transcript_116042/g.369194 Transcript_116042/m.369194 type:complete len:194 (-) Transcript_116042:222-803(-)